MLIFLISRKKNKKKKNFFLKNKMSSLNMSLNDRLAQASKKFTKACEQIKLIKQQISEYIGMFAYNDGSQFSSDSILSTQQQMLINGGHLFQTNNSTTTTTQQNDDFNHNIARENIRQKIETLQNFKSIFFMYAHQKAEEITKLQCELYGEEAVREAYDMAPPEVLIPATNDESLIETNQQTEHDEQQLNDSQTNQEQDIRTDNDWTYTNQNYWIQEQSNQTNDTQSSQLQLIEYSF